eukprot:c13735_g1_i1 orf=299-1735(-)
MRSLRRSRILHRCVYGAPHQRQIEPAYLLKALSERAWQDRLGVLHEASLLNPNHNLNYVHLIAKTHLTNSSEGLLQRRRDAFSHGSLFVRPQSQAFRCLSGVAVTAVSETKTEGTTQALPLPASSTDNFAAALRHYGHCYWELSKARLSMLVVTTAGAGYVMGSGLAIDYYGLSWTCLGTFCVAAAANTINQILEVENDSQMKRTNRRPLPAGRISTEHAMTWAAATSISGVALLASQANIVAAGLGAINLVLYTLVYTPLKQIHPVNTWVGAVVGAVPPLLGWAAAVGEVSMGGWILASALYFWQIPHFMAIAYLCRQDYAAGGFRMLSMQDDSGQRTALAALRNCAYLVPLGFFAYKCGLTTEWFGVETALLSAGMGTTAALFYCKPSTDTARKLFRVSLLYLPLLLTAMIIHRRPNEHADEAFQENLTRDVLGTGHVIDEMEEKMLNRRKVSRPPVAVFSVAPFPFLPVPDYSSS